MATYDLDIDDVEAGAVEETEETPVVESPATEEITEQPTTEEEPEAPASAEEEPEEEEVQEPSTESKPSPRFEKRLRQLSAKVKELKTEAAPAVPAVPQAPQFRPPVFPAQLPEGDYTPEELQSFINQQAIKNGQAFASIEVAQLRQELAMRDEVSAVQQTYNNDLHSIENKYPELNEDSPEFDPQLAQTVTELYEDALLANPKTASLQKVAKSIMDIHSRTATKSSVQAAKTVARQQGASAPAPTAGPTKSAQKWTPEAVEALSLEDYSKYEKEIKRDLYGLQ